jgi:hypothetical protein
MEGFTVVILDAIESMWNGSIITDAEGEDIFAIVSCAIPGRRQHSGMLRTDALRIGARTWTCKRALVT